MIGTDLDGVLCKDEAPWEKRLPRFVGRLLRKPLHRPDADVIITGRLRQDNWYTVLWLRLHGFKQPVYTNLFTPDDAAFWKSLRIRKMGITLFYESDEEQAKLIAKQCPATKVVVMNAKTETKKHRAFGEGRIEWIEKCHRSAVDWIWKQGALGTNFLDVGANYGYAAYYAQQNYACEVQAFDTQPQQVFPTVKVVKADASKVKKFGTFHTAFVNHVLEHVPNYTALLQDLYDNCEEGGFVFIAVPHPRSKDWLVPDAGHITLFTADLLRQQISKVGFKEVKTMTKTFRFGRPEIWTLWEKA